MVTHDPSAVSLGDRSLHLKDGELSELSRKRAAKKKPVSKRPRTAKKSA